jgi:hypothetical protein
VVEERCEPLFPILSCDLTHPLERAARVLPALSPGHVTLGRVPLGQPPSLHCLRRRFLGFVRQLRRYIGAVRLPTSVHHWRSPFGFPTRSAALSAADRRGISRFPYKVLPYMHGVFDRAESEHTLRKRCTRCCLPSIPRTSAPRSICCLRNRGSISRLNTQPVPSPVNASTPSSRTTPHDSGPLWLATPSTCETFTHTTLPVLPAHWNKIEHRMFSFITQNWRGRPLISYQTIVDLIAHTKTKTGLKIKAKLTRGRYPTGLKVRGLDMEELNLKPAAFHPDWNYSLQPQCAQLV